jgi:hypothetical protein
MKLMQVWSANPMWVDEAVSVQNGTSAVVGAGSFKPSSLSLFIFLKKIEVQVLVSVPQIRPTLIPVNSY